MQLPISDHQ